MPIYLLTGVFQKTGNYMTACVASTDMMKIAGLNERLDSLNLRVQECMAACGASTDWRAPLQAMQLQIDGLQDRQDGTSTDWHAALGDVQLQMDALQDTTSTDWRAALGDHMQLQIDSLCAKVDTQMRQCRETCAQLLEECQAACGASMDRADTALSLGLKTAKIARQNKGTLAAVSEGHRGIFAMILQMLHWLHGRCARLEEDPSNSQLPVEDSELRAQLQAFFGLP